MSRADYSSLRDHCGYFIVKAWKVEESGRNVEESGRNVAEDLHLQQLSLEEAGDPETADIQEIYQSDEEKESVESGSFSVEDEKADVESGVRRESVTTSASVIKSLNFYQRH